MTEKWITNVTASLIVLKPEQIRCVFPINLELEIK